MNKQRAMWSMRRETALDQGDANAGTVSVGVVHFTARAASSNPLLHELTVQQTPKRDANGRLLRTGPVMTNAYQAAKLLGPLLACEAAEVFGVLCLTAKCRVIGWCEIGRGSVNRVCVAPRDVFRAATFTNAASLILAHNHPSGESQPSEDDCRLTKHIMEGANLLGIAILDHIIIGAGEYASVRAVPQLSQKPRAESVGLYEGAIGTPYWKDLVWTSGRWALESLDGLDELPLLSERPPCASC